MMIDKLRFQENFKFFDNEIIVEVIDMFITEFPERMKEIRKTLISSSSNPTFKLIEL